MNDNTFKQLDDFKAWLDKENLTRFPYSHYIEQFKREQVEHSLPDEIVEAIEAFKRDDNIIDYWRSLTTNCYSIKRQWVEESISLGRKIWRVKTEHGSFEVGETVNAESLKTGDINLVTIKKFEIANGRMYAHWNDKGSNYRVSQLRKHPSFTFPTDDGIDVTDKRQVVYSLNTTCDVCDTSYAENASQSREYNSSYMKFFSTPEAREAYIKRNRKDKSTADIEIIFDETNSQKSSFYNVAQFKEKFFENLNNK